MSERRENGGRARPVAVVTGATGDIGRHVVAGVLAAGMRVVAIGRDAGRLAALRASLPDAGDTLELAVHDLSLVGASRQAGDAIAARERAVAVLVNNAGIFTTRRGETAEGHERVLATNHLSPFALTAALLPALERHGAARIVNVGSIIAERARLDRGGDPGSWELRRGWSGPRAYARSKLLLAAATFGWAERLRGRGVTANVVHPGSVATGLVRDGVLAPLAWGLMKPFLLTPAQGAEAPLHLALSPGWAGRTGRYTRRMTEAPPGALALDPALIDRVWASTKRIVDP